VADFKGFYMKHWMLFLTVFFLTTSAWSQSSAIMDEGLYFGYQKQIRTTQKSVVMNFAAISSYEQKIFVNALEDLVEAQDPKALEVLSQLEPVTFDLTEQLRIELIKLRTGKAKRLTPLMASQVENLLRSGNADLRVIYLLAAHEQQLLRYNKNLITLAKGYPEYKELNKEARIASDEVLRDLFYRSPDLASVLNGKYAGGVKLFLFCRTTRAYPCMMLMKDAHDQPLRNADGSLWTHKGLASSRYGLPSYSRNGNTPTGILTMNSVMPVADAQSSFGKFRRVILDFIPATTGESSLLEILPESARAEKWWVPSTVARDIGRSDLRIHGSGKLNPDPNSTFFPFLQTSGCISQRENTYGDVTYQDQRILLDSMMKAMDLEAVYENETKIKGVLFITEIDSKNASVELEDLHEKGIQ
jgi:hypothetical protein